MGAFWQNIFVFFRAAPYTLKYALSGRAFASGADEPAGKHPVLADFFGLCVAANEDPASGDYIVERLKELGLTQVRVDFSYESRTGFQEMFLRRLIDEQFRVCLHLVQPRAEAAKMDANENAQNTWREFLAEIFTSYGRELELIEIGSTCNRRKWSGYTLPSYLTAWRIAREMAMANNYPLAAPNVTDFEPIYNIAILNEMKLNNNLPAVHTDNLFVERAVEPEAYDRKIAGKLLAGALRFNLIRKARMLDAIGRDFGVRQTVCSHVSWSLRRIERFLEDSEEKQADYLARYSCLAAAAGALQRVYWGPLVGQREGLIDDGTLEFPEIPHVTYYARARGKVRNYRLRPAYFALQTVNRFVTGTTYSRKIKSERGLEIHEFLAPEGPRHVAWTMNGRRVLARECYPAEALARATFYSRAGVALDGPPIMLTESPTYIQFPEISEFCRARACPSTPLRALSRSKGSPPFFPGIRQPLQAKALHEGKMAPGDDLVRRQKQGEISPTTVIDSLHNIRFAQIKGMQYDFIARGELCGVCRAGAADAVIDMLTALKAGKPAGADILRYARNRVWRIMLGGDKDAAVVIKQFRPLSPAKRLFAKHKGAKALRSWNNAHELLRRGISTPRPIAFFHQADEPLAAASWYVCAEFAGAYSVREAFNAFSRGAAGFEKIPAGELYSQLALFLRKMHDRGVYFRDLSAGNLLFRSGKDGELEFALIDTARAMIYDARLGLRQRLCDLMRICHPLWRQGRRQFVARYLGLTGWRYRAWMNIPFYYYDFKHWLKNHFRRRGQ